MRLRIGHGIDIHQLVKNEKLIIGGISIESSKGSLGHSDGDVLMHALTDSILGALNIGDLGKYFPSDSTKWENANSKIFLEYAIKEMNEHQYKINNIDITIILQKPAISKYINTMKKNVSNIVNTDSNNISIKATTTDKLGYIGNNNGIAAHAITLLIHNDNKL